MNEAAHPLHGIPVSYCLSYWEPFIFPFVPTFFFFHISFYYCITIILVSAASSYFSLAVPIREVSCVGCTPRAWDPRSL